MSAITHRALAPIKAAVRRTLPERVLIHLQAADQWLNGEPELRLLPKLCDRGKAAVDVGANVGTYIYFMRRHAAKVIAFEPNPDLAKRLSRLFPNVTVRPIGLHDHADELVLRVPVQDGRSMHELGSVTQRFESESEVAAYRVPVSRLDDEVPADLPVGFIKVDVEQAEMAVLRGAMGTIAMHRPAIMTEVTPLLYPEPLPAMFRFIIDLGYQGYFSYRNVVRSFDHFVPTRHASAAGWPHDFMNANVILLPRERDPAAVFGGSYQR